VSSEGFLVRFFLGLLGSLALLSVAVGLAAPGRTAEAHVLGAGAPGGSWATPAELDWLARVGLWDKDLVRGIQSAVRMETTPGVSRRLLAHEGPLLRAHADALGFSRTCMHDLTTDVGRPPTTRLDGAFDAFRLACAHLQRFEGAVSHAIDARSAVSLARAQSEARSAAVRFLQADGLLPPGERRSLPVVAGETDASRVEPRFGRIASSLAGKQVEVRCWSNADWGRLMREEEVYTAGTLGPNTLAFAGIGGDRVNLGPGVCTGLAGLAYAAARPADDAGRLLLATAIVTLGHEPQHSRGIATEAVAECNAIQLAPAVARRLGVSPAYAASLVRLYWTHYAEELPAYRSGDCHRGGTLDLGRSDSIWP
jgi:hypothetical protein